MLVVGAVIFFVAVAIGYTWMVSNGMTSFGYARLSDLSIVAFISAIGFLVIRDWRQDSGRNFWPYLVLLHILTLILVTHVLRLFLGGLPCG